MSDALQETKPYLMRKLSLVSLVPFISFRIQIGIMPLPDHFTDLSFLLWYFGSAFARLPALPLGVTALTAAVAFFEAYSPSRESWLSRYARCSLTFLVKVL
jgi:hypothetical protein